MRSTFYMSVCLSPLIAFEPIGRNGYEIHYGGHVIEGGLDVVHFNPVPSSISECQISHQWCISAIIHTALLNNVMKVGRLVLSRTSCFLCISLCKCLAVYLCVCCVSVCISIHLSVCLSLSLCIFLLVCPSLLGPPLVKFVYIWRICMCLLDGTLALSECYHTFEHNLQTLSQGINIKLRPVVFSPLLNKQRS
jgi:hypothetical protein